jgi:hypothetical protein
MNEINILQQIENKKYSKEELAEKIKSNYNLLPDIIKGVSSPKATVRYGCGNVLKLLSEENPKELYPYMDFFIELLDSEYRILTWVAMAIIANLAEVDTDNRFDGIFDKYYSYLNDEYMVTVANVVGNSGRIAKAKPHLAEKITNVLINVEKIKTTPHLTPECRNVIIEHAITSLDMYFDQIENKDEVVSFVKRQLNNSRKTAKMKAEKFLKKND